MTDVKPDLRARIENILSRKEAKSGLHVDDISKTIVDEKGLFPEDLANQSFDDIKKRVMSKLASDVKKKSGAKFAHVKNPKTGKDKKGWYRIKQTTTSIIPQNTKSIPVINPDIVIDAPLKPKKDNLFVGKAGECAVMSELLFRGYNVNQMMVDDGVDIVASMKNIFYYIQVKTTHTDTNNKIYSAIKTDRFDSQIGNQIRYIIVARCNIAGMDTNLYFTSNNHDIQKFLFQGYMNGSDSCINIKIRIDRDRESRPMLYHDNKETDITFHMNRFEL